MAVLKYYKNGEWQKVGAPMAEGVTSVNGQTGDVTISAGVTSVNNKTGAVTLSASDVSAVPTTRTVNGKALSSNITLSASDVGARASSWTPTKSDVGLGNVDNVKQYSASNPPPYPVTSVNGQTGAITINVPSQASDVGAASTSTQFDATLNASSWSSSQYTVSNSAIKATSVVELLPASSITKEQYEALAGAMIVGGTQAAGSIKLKALGDVPTINIPVTFIVRGDM